MGDIVVGVDGSEESRLALRWAASLAERSGTRLRVMAAWTYPALAVLQPTAVPLEPAEEMEQRALDDLGALVKEELGDVPERRTMHVERGPAAGAILQSVDNGNVLVLGSRGRGGFAGLLLGSVSRECIEYAPCPVVIVRHERTVGNTSGPIIVGEDGSENSERALEWALENQDHIGAEVVAAYAWTARMSEVRPGLRERLGSEAGARLASRIGERDVRTVEVEGDPRTELVDIANNLNASMLVVGRRGQSRLRGVLLGGVTIYLVANSPTTIAVIPPPTEA